MADNFFSFTGNITREFGLEHIGQNNTPKVAIGLAVNDRVKDGNDWKDRPNYFDIVVWGDLAVNCSESFDKGDRITVSGKVRWESWEKDGEKKSKVSFTADEVAASVRFATVESTRNPRKNQDGGESF